MSVCDIVELYDSGGSDFFYLDPQPAFRHVSFPDGAGFRDEKTL
jgi:hypothetical protein